MSGGGYPFRPRPEKRRSSKFPSRGQPAPTYFTDEEIKRPPFTQATLEYFFGDESTTVTRRKLKGRHEFQCEKCQTYVPRKRDCTPGETAWITLDHHRPWLDYLLTHGAPDGAGEISEEKRVEAYNDVRNLVAMCNSCNSSKNGPREMFF